MIQKSHVLIPVLPHSGAGTSGGELEDESWKPPDPELTQKLVAQIEYYLSDENLEHDAFLLKHVRRNKLGFVSVKLLTSFKKVTPPPPHPQPSRVHQLKRSVQDLVPQQRPRLTHLVSSTGETLDA